MLGSIIASIQSSPPRSPPPPTHTHTNTHLFFHHSRAICLLTAPYCKNDVCYVVISFLSPLPSFEIFRRGDILYFFFFLIPPPPFLVGVVVECFVRVTKWWHTKATVWTRGLFMLNYRLHSEVLRGEAYVGYLRKLHSRADSAVPTHLFSD